VEGKSLAGKGKRGVKKNKIKKEREKGGGGGGQLWVEGEGVGRC
jgi:hypothetical protein